METNNNRFDVVWRQLSKLATFRDFVVSRDREVYARRARNEGDEFRTVGLATLGASLLAALEKGRFEVEHRGRFHPKSGSVLPAFLYRAWSRIFDDYGNPLYDVGSWAAVDCIRQLTTVFSKLPLEHKPSVCAAILERFRTNEDSLHRDASARLDRWWDNVDGSQWKTPLGVYHDLVSFSNDVRMLVARCLSGADPRDIIPRHGSGASACGTRPWERYGSFRYCPKIDKIWPYANFFFSGASHLCDEYPKLNAAEDLPRQAKAIFVPKDYRGPRLISCEPRELMYIQQGLMTLLYDTLEQGILTSGEINFTDQSVNRDLARRGAQASLSRDQGTDIDDCDHWVTLDLKDASDLVSWDWIQWIFPDNWVEALDACRSTATKLPDGTVVELAKHAPMGSGVCFPVLSLFVWAVIKTAIAASIPARGPNGIERYRKSTPPVYVYGDDVIVRGTHSKLAIEALTRVGLVVNTSKSFTGPHGFRESCGGEYFGGYDVAPIRLKSLCTTKQSDLVKLVSFANNIAKKYGVYEALPLTKMVHDDYKVPILGTSIEAVYDPDEDIRRRINGISHESIETKPFGLIGLAWMKHASLAQLPKRRNKNLQRLEYRTVVIKPVFTDVNADNWSYVLRYQLIGGDDLNTRGRHALSRRVRYKREWARID